MISINEHQANKKTVYDIIKDHQLILVFVTLLGLIISFYLIYLQSYQIEYSLISKDGTMMYQKNFSKYGLFVEKKEIDEGHGQRPIYLLTFKKEPAYFEISSRKAILSEITHIGPNQYIVKFYVVFLAILTLTRTLKYKLIS
jgi:hypothetical protein